MDRVNLVLKNETYKDCLDRICACEKERIFCRHDMAHFLDVARLAYLISLKEEIDAPKEQIYAAALLHDIGRHLQYTQGIPHEEASAQIAPGILRACGFSAKESEKITEAIMRHRDPSVRERRDLAGLLYRGDKLSRACFGCAAQAECDWKKEKKNLELLL